MHNLSSGTMSSMQAQRAEALLRAIVGIDDAIVVMDARSAVARVFVQPAVNSSHRQVVRNVGSALLAGLGVRLPAHAVSIATAAELEQMRTLARPALIEEAFVRSAPSGPSEAVPTPGEASGVAPEPLSAEAQTREAAEADLSMAANGDMHISAESRPMRADYGRSAIHGNAAVNGNGRHNPAAPSNARVGRGEAVRGARARNPDPVHAAAATPLIPAALQPGTPAQAVPTVQSVEVRRIDDKMRCHVTIAAGGRRFAGAGEASADSAAGMLNLVARVTTEAVRASVAAASAIQYDRAVIVELADRRHVVVALHQRRSDEVHALSGAAPVHDRIEDAAARAALAALRELL